MILAAGRGERMRPLSDKLPKPLLPVSGKPLIVWHLEKLAAAGFSDVVINLNHLGDQIIGLLGDGYAWGLRLHYSSESPDALEAAGGIRKALGLLGQNPFLVINGDIWCDWNFSSAKHLLVAGDQAHLILFANPTHNPEGDFVLKEGRVLAVGGTKFTFTGIGIYHPTLFTDLECGAKAKLAPLLYKAIRENKVSGELHNLSLIHI